MQNLPNPAAFSACSPVPVAIELRSGELGQDRAQVFSSPQRTVLVLADGAGGTGSGGEAADLVVAAAKQLFFGQFSSPLAALIDADERLQEIGGQSTGVIVEIAVGVLRGASVGDSVAWLIAASAIEDLTAHQRRKPLIGNRAHVIEFGPLRQRGRLLLASDGLIAYVTVAAISNAVSGEDLTEAARALVALPQLPNGGYPDDVAVVLVELAPGST